MAITQQTVTVAAATAGNTGTATATFAAGAKLIGAVPSIPNPASARPEQLTVRAAITSGGVATVQVTSAVFPVDVLVTVDA